MTDTYHTLYQENLAALEDSLVQESLIIQKA